jgi:hypothetical protein
MQYYERMRMTVDLFCENMNEVLDVHFNVEEIYKCKVFESCGHIQTHREGWEIRHINSFHLDKMNWLFRSGN